MTLTREVLCHNDWVSLCQVADPSAGVGGYVYSTETRCQGRIVAVLPYRTEDGKREYLLKSELTPCWSMTDQVLSSVTGGYEGGDIEDDAVREILEETGYEITREELEDLGTCYASKSSDTVYSLFAVDLTGKVQGVAVGDGSRVESESLALWFGPSKLAEVQDPIVSVMALRLTPPEALETRVAVAMRGTREFQAGAAFGVPGDAHVAYTEGLARAALRQLTSEGLLRVPAP